MKKLIMARPVFAYRKIQASRYVSFNTTTHQPCNRRIVSVLFRLLSLYPINSKNMELNTKQY